MSMVSDGSYRDTQTRYSLALSSALQHFRELLANPSSKNWKPLTPPTSSSPVGSGSNPTSSTSTSTSTTDSKGKSRLSPHSASSTSPSAPPQLSTADLPSGLSPLSPSSVTVHRRADKERGCDVYRAVAEVALDEGRADEVVERARAVLGTGEVRGLWDKLVEQQTTLELLDPQTRIVKTDYRLGWPASPRDTITISRTFLTPSPPSPSSSSSTASTPYYSPGPTLLDLSTSLPRPVSSSNTSSPSAADDEPAFLRPSPPFVRAHLYLGAMGVQVLPPSSPSSTSSPGQPPAAPAPAPARLRLTLFWQWTPRSPLLPSSTVSSSHSASAAYLANQLSAFVGLLRSPEGERLPLLRGWGRGVQVNRDEVAGEVAGGGGGRGMEYAVVGDLAGGGGEAGSEEEGELEVGGNLQGLDELARRRERKRLERAVELSLPKLGVLFDPLPLEREAGGGGEGTAGGAGTGDGWDVRIVVKPRGGEGVNADYAVHLSAPASSSSASPSSLSPGGRLTLRITHAPLSSPSHLVRASVTVQRLAGARCVRVNGAKVKVERVEVRDPLSSLGGRDPLADDAASIRTTSSSSSSGGDAALDSAISIRSTSALSPSHQRSAALSSLLRRSYIYFLSLLQEPPQKWRHVTDSSGVTVTQLLSPDPTLTIYRAEAVFVGVGVWDVYATVVTQGVKGGWDKGVEGVELLPGAFGEDGQGGEEGEGAGGGVGAGLSEVWWERRKGQWPVAPRDSVLLRTAYKSPSSIHVFSSSPPSASSATSPSADSPSATPSASSSSAATAHDLFPGIPPPAPGTIRTHTDLLGWSIEALSPTTTQITLLDQSDPKGWSSKSSWTPSAMVSAVAGVRDWTMKRGAPPVVTRLSGGVRKTREEYDSERGALRVEYAPVGGSSGSSPSHSLPSIASPPTSPSLATSTSTAPPAHPPLPIDRTELEIRCDASTWAPSSSTTGGGGGGIEVMVDPPPLSVAALSRHRLSAGGGLWLTIEHDRAKVVKGEGKVVVTVRKAVASSAASAAGLASPALGAGGVGAGILSGTVPVTVNGARVKVDVEVLDDEKVRELEKRKRVKARPVPLDQYDTLGPRSGAAAVAVAGQGQAAVAGRSTTAGVEKEKEVGIGGEGEMGEGGKGDTKVGGVTDDPQASATVLPAGEATASSDPPADPSSSSIDPTTPAAESTKPPLDPPACALEALAWLQTFHAEQGPELTDPAPGWAIVSERAGAVVRKKLLPQVAADLPVYRGDKIVQGLTADEIASIVTAPGCRRAWDERVDSAVPLASYGHGITTSVLTTKPTFPFKGRVFYLASANASVKVPSASSAASTSTVRFVASASYVPPVDQLDPVKVNPSNLPSGQVYLEGWILETLDPYTSSVLAIPSTRCTYVACIDPKLGNLSSLGLAGSNGGVNLARTIANVEQLGKTKGPLPRLAEPTNGVQVEGPLSDDGEVDCVWKLQVERGKTSEVVAVDYDPAGAAEGGAYRALFRAGGAAGKKRGREATVSSATGTGAEGGADELDLNLARKPPSERRTVSSSILPGGGAGKNKPPSLLSPSLPVGSTLLKSELPRSASLNFGVAAPPILQKTPMSAELAHKTSRSSLRSRSPPGGLPSSSSSVAPSTGASSSTSTLTMKGSQTTITDPGVHDLVVAELVVDLKQYPHGYSVTASSLLIPAVAPQGGSPDEPLSLESLPPRSLAPSASSSSSSASSSTPTQIPLRCTAHDAPLPSILTASLDAWKRANHLVRILVPTGAITHPIKDPLRTDENGESSSSSSSSNSGKPEWFRLLIDGEGALVEVKIVPLPAPPPSTTAAGKAKERERARAEQEAGAAGRVTGQAARSAVFNGEKVTVLSQKESRAVLARFEDDDAPLQGAKISRVPPRKRRKSITPVELDSPTSPSSSLPVELQQPLAIAVRLLAPKPVTPVLDDFDFPDPKSPGAVTPADVESRSPVMGKAAFKPALSRRDTASSADAPSAAGPLLNILNSYPLSRLGSSVMHATAPVVTGDSASLEGGAIATRRTYTLSFVLLVGICSFLLGSLLRSLLTPADYVLYRSETAAAAQTDVENALLQAFDPNRRWREARRLLELRSAWGGRFGWDIIIAAVKRE